MAREFTLTVNGTRHAFAADARESLLDVLRNRLGLSSPRFGCGAEQCGSCSVLIDGEDKPSCAIELAAVENKSIVTLEGLGGAENPHPLQAAFLELQAGQCGYCLSGIMIGAKALLDRNPAPSRGEIAEALSWHLCRCGAHNRIIEAVTLAATRMREST